MYAVNDNVQAIESRNRITEALLALMKQYPYKEITITQICQEAQIVRQTYYRNFDSKDDILKLYLDNMIQLYFRDFYKAEDVHYQLKNFFAYMLKRKEFLSLVSGNSLFFMIDERISDNVTKFLNFRQLTTISELKYEKYVTGFIASTICSLLSLWVDNGFSESPEMLSGLAQKFLGGLNS
ncbi:MAG: TetR/AcrR family transcriptional regulator [Clostridia bacterium]|jgi:AcrR family transcriptional regulator